MNRAKASRTAACCSAEKLFQAGPTASRVMVGMSNTAAKTGEKRLSRSRTLSRAACWIVGISC
jgi:hypothetical protein